MQLLPADLILVRDTDLLSRTIETVTHSPYSHVAMYIGDGKLIEAQGFRRVGYQDPYKYWNVADVYRCDTLTDVQRTAIVRSVESHIGEFYDYALIGVEFIRYVFDIVLPWYEHDVSICSTLVTNDGYRTVGVDLCPGIRNASPGDISKSKLLRNIGPLSGVTL